MHPLEHVHFLAEVSRYQNRVCVAYLKISRGATLIVSVLEAKIGGGLHFSFAYVLGYFFFLILRSLSISLHDMQNGLRC